MLRVALSFSISYQQGEAFFLNKRVTLACLTDFMNEDHGMQVTRPTQRQASLVI